MTYLQLHLKKDVYGIRKDLADYDFCYCGRGRFALSNHLRSRHGKRSGNYPCYTQPSDFSAAGSVVTVLEAQAYSRKVEARFLITRKIEMATMLNVLKESIKDTGVKSFRTAITQRQVYVKSILDGDSVFESSDGAAKGEIEILTKEIVSTFE